MKSKPIRTFTLCDEDGNQYEISEFKTFSTAKLGGDSTIFERPIYRLPDEREVVEIDDEFEILNPPNNIKLQKCE
jgi:hypothetical protein